MKRTLFLSLGLVATFSAGAESEIVPLPESVVYSPRVANQEPVGSFAMPVSALRYEPRVDVQSRNLAEGQADIAIRGGTFENSSLRLGALNLYDPQTGHYLAELPVAPAMLTTPEILTGDQNAFRGWNSTAGTVAYDWRPIRTAGALTLGGGQFGSYHEEIYQGFRGAAGWLGQQVGVDAAVANSGSNGSIAFGESRFDRTNVRLQLAGDNSQTDLVYGYQQKFFGWPNLYTPFNSNETENLQTVLIALNHRAKIFGEGSMEVGAFWRRNKDDYAFNRFAPLSTLHPFQHTTRTSGLSVDGKIPIEDFWLNFKASVVADNLASTSLTFGRYHTRTLTSAGIYPEQRWKMADDQFLSLTAGAGFDDTNRGSSAVSPVVTLARENHAAAAAWSRLYFSYAKTSQVPTYTALNSSPTSGLFRGNPNLGRSTSQNFELGASGAYAGWVATAAVFYRRDHALVDWTYLRGVTARTANAVDLNTVGAELFVRKSLPHFDFALGYTALTKHSDYGSAAVDASFYALNYPKHRLTAAVTVRFGAGWELRMDNDLRLQAVNSLRVIGGDDPILSTLGVYFRPSTWRRVSFSVQVANLWDSHFQAVPAVPAARRQLTVMVSRVW